MKIADLRFETEIFPSIWDYSRHLHRKESGMADEEEQEVTFCHVCHCDEEDCHCYVCVRCEERIVNVCDVCDKCEECCDCAQCENCANICSLSVICRDCDNCENCCDCSTHRGIHPYDYNILDYLNFLPDNNKKYRYFGVELEMYCKRTLDRKICIADMLDCEPDFIIFKSDGSLNDETRGLELNTVPATLEEHKGRWKNLSNLLNTEWEAWSHKDCGIHIHVSRNNLSQLQIGKMLVFMNEQDIPYHRLFVDYIAGRKETSYAGIYKKKISDATKYNCDRYERVNLQNSDTIEFRLFQASTKYNRIMMNIEFINSLLDWCKFTSINEINVKSYIRYMYHYQKKYTFMYPYIEGFLDHPSITLDWSSIIKQKG